MCPSDQEHGTHALKEGSLHSSGMQASPQEGITVHSSKVIITSGKTPASTPPILSSPSQWPILCQGTCWPPVFYQRDVGHQCQQRA